MRILIVIAVIFGASFLNTATAQNKIGHLNSAKLMESLPERDSLANLLQQKQEEKLAQYNRYQAQLKQDYDRYMLEKETMDPSLRQLEESNLANAEANLQQFGQNIQVELAEYEQELIKPLQEKVKAAIKKVAEENGYVYVLDSSLGVTLYEGGVDLYDLVAKKLGIL